jgi:hypothetical protein
MNNTAFDLNIESILDHWEVSHALREIIANALDETVLGGTADVQIMKDRNDRWHVRDFGRGLSIEHFTMNENLEKLHTTNGIIGKFGVGLKDALATLHRRGVGVSICSRFGVFRLTEHSKHNFDDIVTLHIMCETGNPSHIGTDFAFENLSDEDIAKSKSYFLVFSNEHELEATSYGGILERSQGGARVYINGVLANVEQNFLFSYNITNLTESMKKELNRERVNIGRSVYTDRVKSILRACRSSRVLNLLANQLANRVEGNQCDELQWLDVRQLAINTLQKMARVTFLTQKEISSAPEVIHKIQSDGYHVVPIDEAEKFKVVQQEQQGGPAVRTLENYFQEYNQSFQYKFVTEQELTEPERFIFALAPKIANLIGVSVTQLPRVLVSETMRLDRTDTLGVWDPQINAIVILRNQLTSARSFAGTLLHEIAHAMTGYDDCTVEFETVLTNYIGALAMHEMNGQSAQAGKSSNLQQTWGHHSSMVAKRET